MTKSFDNLPFNNVVGMKKLAAKEKHNRKKIVSMLEKTKNSYSKLKTTLDDLEGQAAKINASLEKIRSNCGEARKDMLKYHKAIQNMDLSGASEAVFYDSGDISYVIDGGECALDIDDSGDLVKTKWRDRAKKSKKDENQAPYDPALDDDDSEDGSNDVNDLRFMDVNNVDELYHNFMSEAMQELNEKNLFSFGSNSLNDDSELSLKKAIAKLNAEIDLLG